MRRSADFAITDEAEKNDHESLAEKSIMAATKYKEEAKLEIEKSCLETMIAKREMTISQFEIHYKPEFGISDCRFSCYARFPIGAYYICPPNNMDGKMQNCKVQMKFTL